MDINSADTFIFIDVSNIQCACRRSCNFRIDFVKLYRYFQHKYQHLRDVRYYEGVSAEDYRKQQTFRYLADKVGYTICSLARKSYNNPAKYQTFICNNCQAKNTVQILPPQTKLKSNVDVYLAADMFACATNQHNSSHIILVSCDGDYAEAIRAIIQHNPNIFITILATPMTRKNNCLSTRLKQLRKDLPNNIDVANILTIRDFISA